MDNIKQIKNDIYNFMINKHYVCDRNWLDQCIENCLKEKKDSKLLRNLVFNIWKQSNLKKISTCSTLNKDLKSKSINIEILTGTHCVQIESAINIQLSYYHQLNDQKFEESTQSGTRMLLFRISDGISDFLAVEDQRLLYFDQNKFLPGLKAILKGPILYVKKRLFLRPDNITFIGGYIEEFLELYNPHNIMKKILNIKNISKLNKILSQNTQDLFNIIETSTSHPMKKEENEFFYDDGIDLLLFNIDTESTSTRNNNFLPKTNNNRQQDDFYQDDELFANVDMFMDDELALTICNNKNTEENKTHSNSLNENHQNLNNKKKDKKVTSQNTKGFFIPNNKKRPCDDDDDDDDFESNEVNKKIQKTNSSIRDFSFAKQMKGNNMSPSNMIREKVIDNYSSKIKHEIKNELLTQLNSSSKNNFIPEIKGDCQSSNFSNENVLNSSSSLNKSIQDDIELTLIEEVQKSHKDEEEIFIIRAQSVRLLKKLTANNNKWSLTLLLSDGETRLPFVFSNNVIKKIVGMSAQEYNKVRSNVDNSNYQKLLQEIGSKIRDRLKKLDAIMTVEYKAENEYPTVLNIIKYFN